LRQVTKDFFRHALGTLKAKKGAQTQCAVEDEPSTAWTLGPQG